MQKDIYETSAAPAPIGPYSQAVGTGNLVFLSGQIALDPDTGELLLSDIDSETHRIMKNIEAVLTAAGLGFEHIVKTSIFLRDMNDFAAVNTVYGSYFTDGFPARECVQVSVLPKHVNVEISVTAAR